MFKFNSQTFLREPMVGGGNDVALLLSRFSNEVSALHLDYLITSFQDLTIPPSSCNVCLIFLVTCSKYSVYIMEIDLSLQSRIWYYFASFCIRTKFYRRMNIFFITVPLSSFFHSSILHAIWTGRNPLRPSSCWDAYYQTTKVWYEC